VTSETTIIAMLATIEQQNKLVIELLAKMAGGEAPAQVEDGISPIRRMEIIQMAADAARTPGRKKQSPAEVRA